MTLASRVLRLLVDDVGIDEVEAELEQLRAESENAPERRRRRRPRRAPEKVAHLADELARRRARNALGKG